MAGPSWSNNNSMVTAITEQFEVQYARFFTYSNLPSTHPSLTPLSSAHTKRFKGQWISTSSTTASLKLVPSSSSVLIVTFLHKVLEEHYISKLHFSWPQVSCVSGYPARGSRAVFVSFKDSKGQSQKFAVRFSKISESEKFMNALKEILEDARVAGIPCRDFGSGISSQTEFVRSNEIPYRPREDWSYMTSASADTFAQQMPPCLNKEVAENLNFQETIFNHNANHDREDIFSGFPPSFTSLLTNCCPAVEQDAIRPSVSNEVDLKAQIMRCLEDSSFLDILCKVEKVISEMGDDVML